jgi:hypothetical protein
VLGLFDEIFSDGSRAMRRIVPGKRANYYLKGA